MNTQKCSQTKTSHSEASADRSVDRMTRRLGIITARKYWCSTCRGYHVTSGLIGQWEKAHAQYTISKTR